MAARKPNYNFERKERERVKAAKKAARMEAKRAKTEKGNDENASPDSNSRSPGESE